MSKTYQKNQEETVIAAEPVATYGVSNTITNPSKVFTTKERVMASTMSVDEYFDELVTLVHKDYANL